LAQLKEKNMVILPGWDPVNVEVIAETPMSDFTQVCDLVLIVSNVYKVHEKCH
jgi:hypothetical protein